MQQSNLVGHGPSKASIVDNGRCKVVVKNFPDSEQDRVIKETKKMNELYELSKYTILFKVPKILDIQKTSYTMEYIPNCMELNDRFFNYDMGTIAKKIKTIIKVLSLQPCDDNKITVWDAMVKKFKAVKTDNNEYNDLVDSISSEKIDIPKGYSHGDLTFDNIIMDDSGILYLIDPAWSEAESPLWDVGKVLQSTRVDWGYIKKNGRCNPNIDQNLYLINNMILNELQYNPEHILLATACQLSRVARWCFADVLIPVVVDFLKVYKEKNNDKLINTLRGSL